MAPLRLLDVLLRRSILQSGPTLLRSDLDTVPNDTPTHTAYGEVRPSDLHSSEQR